MHLHPAAFEFLNAINDYNTRKFFWTVKPLYEEIRENLKDICTESIKQIATFDTDIADLEPKDCLFRIYRDARRLKEWDPLYKQNRWFVLSPGWKNSSLPWYYFHLQPWDKSFFGGWVYRPEPSHLRNLRHYLSQHWATYKKIMQKAAFKKHFGAIHGDVLSRPPQWFKAYTPYLDLVQRKQHLIYAKFTDKEILSTDIVKLFVDHAKYAYERMHFLRVWSLSKQ